jgi:hypothetical protein
MTHHMSTEERVKAAQSIRPGFGDGWLSKSAVDMIRVAAFAGFDIAELTRKVAIGSDPSRITNTATVERVMSEMLADFDAEHPDLSMRTE